MKNKRLISFMLALLCLCGSLYQIPHFLPTFQILCKLQITFLPNLLALPPPP